MKLSRSNPNVNIRLQENIRAEDARRCRMRKELQDLMSCKRKQLDLKAQIEKAKAITKQSEMTLNRSRAVVAAMTDVRAFSASQCGHGKKGGGTKEHRANRFQVLERMRLIGNLTQEQTHQWDFFIHNWDEQRAAADQEQWGVRFLEEMQHILEKMAGGQGNAFSEYVRDQTNAGLECNGCIARSGVPVRPSGLSEDGRVNIKTPFVYRTSVVAEENIRCGVSAIIGLENSRCCGGAIKLSEL